MSPEPALENGEAPDRPQEAEAASAADATALHAELRALRQGRDQLQAQLQAMRESTSWRLTRPLRELGDLARRLRPMVLLGAARRLVGRVARERDRWGWAGVIRRLPAYWTRRRQLLRALVNDAPTPAIPAPAAVPPPVLPLHPDLLADAPEPIDTTVSIVIPTLDAGPEFGFLLRKLRQQRGIGRIELIVIDSGSGDGTAERAEAAGAQVQRIPAADFSHSGTRNLGAERAGGEYLLFMVQDAYPVGEHWLNGLVRVLRDGRDRGLAAVSCVESCRADSDLWVECAIATHSSFLGCRDADRVGVLAGTDHERLRAMGQLSDVACLMRRDLFRQYLYRGRYAEDLDLGVRLIRDGHRIAMLSSLPIVHSHLRTSMYTLKRGFVDLCVLRELFPDFPVTPCDDPAAVVVATRHLAREVDAWMAMLTAGPDALEGGGTGGPGARTERWLSALRRQDIRGELPAAPLRLDDPRLDRFVRTLGAGLEEDGVDAAAAAQRPWARRTVDDFIVRFDHFNRYASTVHDVDDAQVRRQWAAAAAKALAATLAAQLAGCHLGRGGAQADDPVGRWIGRLAAELTRGV